MFGGSCAEYTEGTARSLGNFDNQICIFDDATRSWDSPTLDDDTGVGMAMQPERREHTSIVYDHKESRLVIFGGWNNKWVSDIWAVNVSKIVGPPYSISEIEPAMGPLTGKTPCIVKGIGFNERSDKYYVHFINTQGKTTDVVAPEVEFIDNTTLRILTPDFLNFGPKECVVRIAINEGDISVTNTNFL